MPSGALAWPEKRNRQVASVAAEVAISSEDLPISSRRDRANQKVSGAAGNSRCAAAVGVFRREFVILGSKRGLRERPQKVTQPEKHRFLPKAGKNFLPYGADEVGTARLKQVRQLAFERLISGAESLFAASQRKRPDGRVN